MYTEAHSLYGIIKKNKNMLCMLIFFVYFFGGLEYVGHSFAYVAHL
jgi:hypothetical protein